MSRTHRRATVGRAALVALLVAATLTIGEPAHAASAFIPVADTFVTSADPGTNFGSKVYLKADASPRQVTYLRFDVQGVEPGASAVLRFYAESSLRAGVEAHQVSDNGWGETTVTYTNAPAVGAAVDASGPISAGTWVSLNVSAMVPDDGPVTIALTTTDDTAVRITSREGTNKPQLLVPAPSSPSPFVVTATSGGYQAVSQTTGQTYAGSLKFVVERAVSDLNETGGGTVQFAAGVFELGAEYFKLVQISDIAFAGAGVDETVIRNYSSTASDTEPFNFTGAFGVTVRDLTVSAGGPTRSTSDALDFDEGNDVLVERVKVTAARGRGIVFDGKNADWTSTGNTVRDCVVVGVPGDGIELLASSGDTITGCRITDVGGHGIQINKSSPTADQPNKKATRNVVAGNTITQAGQDGINVTSGDDNEITGNTITDSSDDTSGRDGIRITSTDAVSCDGNRVWGNLATDDQTTRTQKYGLNIASTLCHSTVVGPDNVLTGNLVGPIRDVGTGTIYPSASR
ncbi:CBM96 family carbohydrate-binding protein [Micromonospora sp. IBHARD004]|uniref:CBM96 family carbohydrate-binding protein n=1 Tax=Micromonospora sp. IBHARD004 TaxID=3457764 RepID=UPI00405925D5